MTSTLELLALVLAICGSIGAAIGWYRSTVVQARDRERDMKHLVRNYEQLNQAIAQLMDEIEQSNRTMLEQKMLILAIQQRQEGIAARLDSTTSGWTRRE